MSLRCTNECRYYLSNDTSSWINLPCVVLKSVPCNPSSLYSSPSWSLVITASCWQTMEYPGGTQKYVNTCPPHYFLGPKLVSATSLLRYFEVEEGGSLPTVLNSILLKLGKGEFYLYLSLFVLLNETKSSHYLQSHLNQTQIDWLTGSSHEQKRKLSLFPSSISW
jgi:hypothetical protein